MKLEKDKIMSLIKEEVEKIKTFKSLKEEKEAIIKTLKEEYGLDDDEIWSKFDPNEFEGPAKQAALKDIQGAGEKFVDIGKSKFEKGIKPTEFADKIAQANVKTSQEEKELNRLKHNATVKAKHEKQFGVGSLNENPGHEHILDSKGAPIKIGARVEDLETGDVGRVVRFGIDNDNKNNVHVNWMHVGEKQPNPITYPHSIVVNDKTKINELLTVDNQQKTIVSEEENEAEKVFQESLTYKSIWNTVKYRFPNYNKALNEDATKAVNYIFHAIQAKCAKNYKTESWEKMKTFLLNKIETRII